MGRTESRPNPRRCPDCDGWLEADLAGAVAAQVGVEVAVLELAGLVARRRGGELGMQQAAVAGEATARGRDGNHHLVRERAGDRLELAVQPEMPARAGRMDGG